MTCQLAYCWNLLLYGGCGHLRTDEYYARKETTGRVYKLPFAAVNQLIAFPSELSASREGECSGNDYDWITEQLDVLLNKSQGHPALFDEHVEARHQNRYLVPRKVVTADCKIIISARLGRELCYGDHWDLRNKVHETNWSRLKKTTVQKWSSPFGFVAPLSSFAGWDHFTVANITDDCIIREFAAKPPLGAITGCLVATDPTDMNFLGISWLR